MLIHYQFSLFHSLRKRFSKFTAVVNFPVTRFAKNFQGSLFSEILSVKDQ